MHLWVDNIGLLLDPWLSILMLDEIKKGRFQFVETVAVCGGSLEIPALGRFQRSPTNTISVQAGGNSLSEISGDEATDHDGGLPREV